MKDIYTYMPEKNYKKLTGFITLLSCGAVCLFTITYIFPSMPLKWLLQLGGLLALGAMVFIVSRYIMRKTVYALVEDESGRVDFTVTEITNKGRSQITVCRFDVRNIEMIDLFYKEDTEDKTRCKEMSKKARKEHRSTFNYCPDILSDPVCFIFANEGVGPFFIKIAPDEYIYNYLQDTVINDDSTEKDE